MGKLNSEINLEYWNNIGVQKKFNNPNLILSELNHLPKSIKILDIGCGQGRTLVELKEKGYNNLYGVDYSKSMISSAGINLDSETNLFVSKGNSLPFEDNSFDAVLLFAVLNCVPNPEEEIEIVQESLRVLKAGGYLLVNDFVISSDQSKYQFNEDKFGKFGLFQIEDACYMRHTTPERVINMVEAATVIFEIVEVYQSMNGNPVAISSHIFKTLE